LLFFSFETRERERERAAAVGGGGRERRRERRKRRGRGLFSRGRSIWSNRLEIRAEAPFHPILVAVIENHLRFEHQNERRK
jgi:hypothetical protein